MKAMVANPHPGLVSNWLRCIVPIAAAHDKQELFQPLSVEVFPKVD
jgi:hypothetical protein